MAGKVSLTSGAGHVAKINHAGELQVAQGEYDTAKYAELAADNTIYNVWGPMPKSHFILTGMIAVGDKEINAATNAIVVIYSCVSATGAVGDAGSTILLKFEIGQNMAIPVTGLRMAINPGLYINATTTDDDVHLTLIGHYLMQSHSEHF